MHIKLFVCVHFFLEKKSLETQKYSSQQKSAAQQSPA